MFGWGCSHRIVPEAHIHFKGLSLSLKKHTALRILTTQKCFEDLYTPAIQVHTLPFQGPTILRAFFFLKLWSWFRSNCRLNRFKKWMSGQHQSLFIIFSRVTWVTWAYVSKKGSSSNYRFLFAVDKYRKLYSNIGNYMRIWRFPFWTDLSLSGNNSSFLLSHFFKLLCSADITQFCIDVSLTCVLSWRDFYFMILQTLE